MANLSYLEAFKDISVSTTALIFLIMLFIIVKLFHINQTGAMRRFTTIIIVVITADVVSCLWYFVFHTQISVEHPALIAFLYTLMQFMDMTLIFHFLNYLDHYFGNDISYKSTKMIINMAVLIIAGIALFAAFFFNLRKLDDQSGMPLAPTWLIAVVSVVELYYLINFIAIFIKRKGKVSKRTYNTAVYAVILAAVSLVLEMFNVTGIVVEYLGITLGLYLFYLGVEAPEYNELIRVIPKLEEAKRQADEANKAKSEFLASMSHEIRTPINSILGMNEMVIREARENNVITYAKNVESAGRNLLMLINDILDFSKIEAGRIEIIDAPYRLSSLLNDLVNATQVKADAKGLEFAIEVDKNIPDELYGDESRIVQIINNLLSNAVKYTNTGKVTFEVGMSESENGIDLCVDVSDTGIGVKHEDIDKLFLKFERVDQVRNKNVEGTGLGLAITKQLVEMMGGSIGVESEYEVGSRFYVRLPQRVVSDEPIGDFKQKFLDSIDKSKEYKESFVAQDVRLLVVDDTPMNLQVIEGLLKKTRINIDAAISGQDALELTKNTKYDLILMDQRMPKMSGSETLWRIREQSDGLNDTTPVICLTADAVTGARNRYLTEGFDDYLAKPVEGEQLEKAIMRMLPTDKFTVVDADADGGDNGAFLPEFYDSQADMDYEQAIKYNLNDTQLIETIKIFYDSIDENANLISKYAQDEDYENYGIFVHALKSSARIIGAMRMSGMSAEFEGAADRAKDADEAAILMVKAGTPRLVALYRSYKDILSPLFGGDTSSKADIMQADDELIRELYAATLEYAQIFDIDSIEAMLKQTEKYSFPKDEELRIAALKKAVINSDWDKIENIARGRD